MWLEGGAGASNQTPLVANFGHRPVLLVTQIFLEYSTAKVQFLIDHLSCYNKSFKLKEKTTDFFQMVDFDSWIALQIMKYNTPPYLLRFRPDVYLYLTEYAFTLNCTKKLINCLFVTLHNEDEGVEKPRSINYLESRKWWSVLRMHTCRPAS